MSPCLFLISYPYHSLRCKNAMWMWEDVLSSAPTCKWDLCEDPIPSSPIISMVRPLISPFHAQGQTVHINLCRKQLHKCGTLFLSGSGSEASIEDVIGKVSFLFFISYSLWPKSLPAQVEERVSAFSGVLGLRWLDFGAGLRLFLKILTIPVHTLYICMATIYDTVWLKTDTNLTENGPNWWKTDTNDWKRTPIDWKRKPIAAHNDHF